MADVTECKLVSEVTADLSGVIADLSDVSADLPDVIADRLLPDELRPDRLVADVALAPPVDSASVVSAVPRLGPCDVASDLEAVVDTPVSLSVSLPCSADDGFAELFSSADRVVVVVVVALNGVFSLEL